MWVLSWELGLGIGSAYALIGREGLTRGAYRADDAHLLYPRLVGDRDHCSVAWTYQFYWLGSHIMQVDTLGKGSLLFCLIFRFLPFHDGHIVGKTSPHHWMLRLA